MLYLVFSALAGVLILLQRSTSAPTVRTPLVWFVLGLAFVALVYPLYAHGWFGATLDEPSDNPGADASMMYVSAYLAEYALSFDAVRATIETCHAHGVPRQHRARVLRWGLVGAVLVRAGVLVGAASLVRAVPGVVYVLGGLVLWSAVLAWRADGEPDDESRPSWLQTHLLRRGWIAGGEHDGILWVSRNGRRLLTRAGACVLSIALAETVFALDSITLLSVSRTMFVVVAASVLATIAQRSWLVVPNVERVPFSRRTATALLVLVGIKLLVREHLHVPPAVWLAVIAGLVGVGVAETVVLARRGAR